MCAPIRRTLLVAAALTPTLVAARPLGETLTLAPQSKLWIEGSSTIRKFTCKAGTFETAVDAAAGAVDAVLAGQRAVRTVRVTVPAAKLDCGNGTMNDHMWKAIKAGEHPTIDFNVAGYDVAAAGEGVRGTLTGALTLGGVTRTVTVPAEGRAAGPGALRVTGAAEVRMKEFGLKPPTLMMGTLKVDGRVTVHFDLVLKS